MENFPASGNGLMLVLLVHASGLHPRPVVLSRGWNSTASRRVGSLLCIPLCCLNMCEIPHNLANMSPWRSELVSSSRNGNGEFEYDVFLSFRGSDTRKGFTGNLYQALTERGIRVFMEHEKLRKGEQLEAIFRAIEISEIFIAVFSQHYADSRWCLAEITKIVHCGRMIIPVFFDVDPSDVRNQRGPFETAFTAHENNMIL